MFPLTLKSISNTLWSVVLDNSKRCNNTPGCCFHFKPPVCLCGIGGHFNSLHRGDDSILGFISEIRQKNNTPISHNKMKMLLKFTMCVFEKNWSHFNLGFHCSHFWFLLLVQLCLKTKFWELCFLFLLEFSHIHRL